MKCKGTTDAIFIVRQLQEKYLAKNRDLWMAFIDLENAFDSAKNGDMVGASEVGCWGVAGGSGKVDV